MSTVIDDHAHGHEHAHGPAKGLMLSLIHI